MFRLGYSRIADQVKRWITGSRPGLLTKAAAEFTGCMIFHFLGSVSPTATTNAVTLMVMVYYTAKLSGAHLNPALTTTFYLLGYTNPLEVLVYWVAQISGCIFGAMITSAMVPELAIGSAVTPSDYAVSGCFQAAPGITPSHVFGWEAMGTFCFILPIFSVVWYTQSKSGYGNTGPIIVGLSLYAAASAIGPFTGGAFNPARVVASAVVFKCPGGASIWSYVAGEFAGALVVPIAIIPWYGVSASLSSSTDRDEDSRESRESRDSRYVRDSRDSRDSRDIEASTNSYTFEPSASEVAAAEDLLSGGVVVVEPGNRTSNHKSNARTPEGSEPKTGTRKRRNANSGNINQNSYSINDPAGDENFVENVYQCMPIHRTKLLPGFLLTNTNTQGTMFKSASKSLFTTASGTAAEATSAPKDIAEATSAPKDIAEATSSPKDVFSGHVSIEIDESHQ